MCNLIFNHDSLRLETRKDKHHIIFFFSQHRFLDIIATKGHLDLVFGSHLVTNLKMSMDASNKVSLRSVQKRSLKCVLMMHTLTHVGTSTYCTMPLAQS